jgi:hypothetical protein
MWCILSEKGLDRLDDLLAVLTLIGNDLGVVPASEHLRQFVELGGQGLNLERLLSESLLGSLDTPLPS